MLACLVVQYTYCPGACPRLVLRLILLFLQNASLWLTHVGHVQLKHYGFCAGLIFTFIFFLVSPAGFIGSEQDWYQTEDKETLCNQAYDLW